MENGWTNSTGTPPTRPSTESAAHAALVETARRAASFAGAASLISGARRGGDAPSAKPTERLYEGVGCDIVLPDSASFARARVVRAGTRLSAPVGKAEG